MVSSGRTKSVGIGRSITPEIAVLVFDPARSDFSTPQCHDREFDVVNVLLTVMRSDGDRRRVRTGHADSNAAAPKLRGEYPVSIESEPVETQTGSHRGLHCEETARPVVRSVRSIDRKI